MGVGDSGGKWGGGGSGSLSSILQSKVIAFIVFVCLSVCGRVIHGYIMITRLSWSPATLYGLRHILAFMPKAAT